MSTRLVKGTPVISLADGSTLGAIDHVYFDPGRLAVVGFTFHKGGLFGGGTSGLVEIADVHAFGPDAVTITDISVVHCDLALEAKVAQRDVADLDFRRSGAGAAACRRLHGSPRLGGEFAQHEVLELHALCRIEHVALH